MSEEFATDDDKIKQKLLVEIVSSLELPSDLGVLEDERAKAGGGARRSWNASIS